MAEPRCQFRVRLCSPPLACPLPIFGSVHQLCSERISLHVASDRQEMPVCLHGKGLESSLIHRSSPSGVMVGMPALGVGDGDPSEHLGEFTIPSRPQEQMPMVGHQAVGGDANLGLACGLRPGSFQRRRNSPSSLSSYRFTATASRNPNACRRASKLLNSGLPRSESIL